MSSYVLAPSAQRDLIRIRSYYEGVASARTVRNLISEFVHAFRTLAKTPRMGHRRTDLTIYPQLLFWPVREYMIIYRVVAERVEILSIAHGRRDLSALIQDREL